MLQTVLLVLHISGGTLALLSGLAAMVVQAVHGPHKAHVLAGRLFVLGMLMVVVSAVPLSVITGSVLLLLIGVFSGYLMLAGWRFAKNRRGKPTAVDWVLAGAMLVASIAMIIYGLITVAGQGVILIVFGVIGGLLAVSHGLLLRGGAVRGRVRIASHLRWMIAAFIAALTAFMVVNATSVLGIFAWFLPTIVLTPMIVVWSRKIASGARTTLDRTPNSRVSQP